MKRLGSGNFVLFLEILDKKIGDNNQLQTMGKKD